ncbi:MAG: type I secretion system permease/ATPase [Rhodospirillaceae bacterium]|nr:type I secretion system permease/ATPase [Rhodospirillaceae bacterium]
MDGSVQKDEPGEPLDASRDKPSDVLDKATDGLTWSLAFLTKYFGRAYEPGQLQAGLPLDKQGHLTPDGVIASAERIGMAAERERVQLSEIPGLALPAILLLKGGDACVLLAIDGETVEIADRSVSDGLRKLPLAELENTYGGEAIYARPRFYFDQRAYTLDLPQPKNWFWGAMRENWWIYGHAILATLIVNLMAVAIPVFIMTVYDRVVPNNSLETLWVLVVGMVCIGVFDFVLRGLRSYLIDVAGRRLDVLLGNRIFEHVLHSRIDKRSSSAGALASTLREFDQLRDFLGSATMTAFGDLPFILLFVLVIYLIGGPIAWVLIVAVPIVLVVGILIQIPLNKVTKRSMREATQRNSLLFEVLNGMETLKAIRAEAWAQRQWEHFVALTAVSSMKMKMLTVAMTHLAMVATILTTVGIVAVGVHEIQTGALTLGGMIACVLLNNRVMQPMAQAAGLLVRLDQMKLAFNALHQLMQVPLERSPSEKLVHKPSLQGAIEFDRVSFTYPGEAAPAIGNISYSIEPGERVALLGRIGSGKSTILKLMQMLYRPNEGYIRVDGLDYTQIEPDDIRRQMGYVPQDSVLFHGTIRDNLVQGTPYASDEDVVRAVEKSGLADLVRRLPRGLDHEVGEQGANMSGGQRQMVTLTRALLPEPRIMLMDEPTSDMDNFAERHFMTNMKEWLEGRTLLLVTHKRSLLDLVERIIVVEGGEIVADGPKQKVIEELAAKQKRMQERSDAG